MCTVSWSVREQGYRLFFNRDERKTRPRAERPKVLVRNGCRLIAPIDPEGGGSWIAVSERGGTAFLLNNYGATGSSSREATYRTRGEIPLRLACSANGEERMSLIRECSSAEYRPFFIGYLSKGESAMFFSWDGRSLESIDLDMPFYTTSSFKSREIEPYRSKRYRDYAFSEGSKWAWESGIDYHCDIAHEDPAFNPAMSRSDAETHCISIVTVTDGGIRFEYRERVGGRFSDAIETGFESTGD